MPHPARRFPARRRDAVHLRGSLLVGAIVALMVAVALAPNLGAQVGAENVDNLVQPADAPADADPGATYRHVATWRPPPGSGAPLDVSLAPDGTLFVADGRHNAVHVYAPSGERTQVWDHPPIGRAAGFVFVPRAVVVDGAVGHVHIVWERFVEPRAQGADLTSNGLFLDSRLPDGEALRPLRVLGAMSTVRDMAVHPGSGDLYILAGGEVVEIRMPVAIETGRWPVPGSNPASNVAVTPDDRIALTRPEAGHLTVHNLAGAQVATIDLDGAGPVAVAADNDGGLHTLVHPVVPDGPALLVFDATGVGIAAYSADELGAPPPPHAGWPWGLAVSEAGVAFSTADAHFKVRRILGTAVDTLVGAGTLEHFEPIDPSGDAVAARALRLATMPSGELVVLDALDGRVIAMDDSGARVIGPAPMRALDVASGDDRFVVSTRDGELQGFLHGAGRPRWVAPCECDLGGRLALDGDRVAVTWPRVHRIGIFDADTGRLADTIYHPGAAGLWPSDVAVAPGGWLAANPADRLVQAFGRLEATQWPAGLLAGPRHLAAGGLAPQAPALAALMADGAVEVHTQDGNLVARWTPTVGPDRVLAPDDIAMDAHGRVFLSDGHDRAVYVFALTQGDGDVPIEPTPAPPPGPDACQITASKAADPDRVDPGDPISISLTVDADCPEGTGLDGADIVLVVDRSGSMVEASMTAAVGAAGAFLELLDARRHRVGLVSFAGDARLDVPLSHDLPAVMDGLRDLLTDGETNLADALGVADAHLAATARPNVVEVIVLLTDGRHNAGADDPVAMADSARERGTIVHAVGLGAAVDADLLLKMAGSVDRTHLAPTPQDLFPIYEGILRQVVDALPGNLIVDERLVPALPYLSGSMAPMGLARPNRLRWGRSAMPEDSLTLQYSVRAEQPGIHPAAELGVVEYTDVDGIRRRIVLEQPGVTVREPPVTPTVQPSSTPAATATATSTEPRPRYTVWVPTVLTGPIR